MKGFERKRRSRGMTQEELARLTGIQQSYLSKLARGVNAPTLATAIKIADALKMSITAAFCDWRDDDEVGQNE